MPGRRWTYPRNAGRNPAGPAMVHFRLVCRSRTAREDVLAELIFDVKVILHLVSDVRSLLPLVDKSGILARQDCLRVHPGHCNGLLRIEFDETLLIEHTSGSLAAELRSSHHNSPRCPQFQLDLLFDKSAVLHSSISLIAMQGYKFPRFSTNNSQDFQSIPP